MTRCQFSTGQFYTVAFAPCNSPPVEDLARRRTATVGESRGGELHRAKATMLKRPLLNYHCRDPGIARAEEAELYMLTSVSTKHVKQIQHILYFVIVKEYKVVRQNVSTK
ncbi:d7.2 [Tranosema rostrale ichnovirus]|nr:d7.2 [Tranosema rostrale ichnovirus]